MKKIFTLVATALMACGAYAQIEDVVELSHSTTDMTTSTNNLWTFTGTNITMVPNGTSGRTPGSGNTGPKNETMGPSWTNGLNIKNNALYTIQLPEGVELYRVEMFGFSSGDNWTYLYAYGIGDQVAADGNSYEWVEPIGKDVKDNETIYTTAKYSIDPCAKTELNNEYSFNVSGYTFCVLDFGTEPYTGEFPMLFSGNNQERVAFRLFLSRAAADLGISGVETVEVVEVNDEPCYNVAGQQVPGNYKGIVIQGGKKYIRR